MDLLQKLQLERSALEGEMEKAWVALESLDRHLRAFSESLCEMHGASVVLGKILHHASAQVSRDC